MFKTLNVKELQSFLLEHQVLLIDVREPEEYVISHIERSVNIPLSKLDIKGLSYRDRKIVLYCRSGYRSLEGCKKIYAQDPSLELYSLSGGLLAWEKK
ncbi:MAG: rhodanese-like domain-containing protein [Rhabdochlamydiaceae bacterium]